MLGPATKLLPKLGPQSVPHERPYVESAATDWFPKDLNPRLKTLQRDIASLSDFDTHLNDKLQFLLDATLGFISIAQNNVMKVMTIASVAGIPPVLIVGIYGLCLIVLTTLIPLAAFRWQKWL